MKSIEIVRNDSTGMSVQELIDRLTEIEDKEREITVVVGRSAASKPIVFDAGSGNIYIGD